MTTNTEKGSEVVKISAFVEKDPNAAAKKPGAATINPLNNGSGSAVKTSTQPGHEGHNHN